MVIAESAILKTGHIRKSRKSITYPNLIRSTRLPAAPPSIRAMDIPGRIPTCRRLTRIIEISIMTRTENAIKKPARSRRSPKAAPLLYTNVIWKTLETTFIDCPKAKDFMTKYLVRRSAANTSAARIKIKGRSPRSINSLFSSGTLCRVRCAAELQACAWLPGVRMKDNSHMNHHQLSSELRR